VSLQGVFSLQDDDCANVVSGQIGGGCRQYFRISALGAGGGLSTESADNGQAFEQPPQILLEDDYEDKYEDGEKSLEDDGGQIKLKEPCGNVNGADDAETDEDKPGGPVFEPHQEEVDHQRNDDYVKDILNAKVADEGEKGLH